MHMRMYINGDRVCGNGADVQSFASCGRSLVCLCGRVSVELLFLICESRREWVGEQSFRISRWQCSLPILRLFFAMTTSQVPGRETYDSVSSPACPVYKAPRRCFDRTCTGKIVSVSCSSYTNSTVLCIPTSQRVFGRRNEKARTEFSGLASALSEVPVRANDDTDSRFGSAR
jgi:hypothetical protein